MLVGIIGAMQEEVKPLLAQMINVEIIKYGNHTFYKGRLLGKDVVLTESGIGKVQAGSTATILITIFKVTHIVNTGSAGSLLKEGESAIGDVIISDQVAYHDVDLTIFNYKQGQLPGQPEIYDADPKLIELAKGSAGTHNLVGLIVSGDQFISTDEQRAKIYARYPNAAACEMEGAAIAQIAHNFNIPFVVVRSISDGANIQSKVSFNDFLPTASLNAAKMVNQIVCNINDE